MRWSILVLFVAVLTSGCSSSDPRGDAFTEIGSPAPESKDSTWIVKGRVRDGETMEPLIGANVIMQYRIREIDSVCTTVTATNFDGYFKILIRSKKQPIGMTLHTKYIAYDNQSLELSDFNEGTVLDIKEIYLASDLDWCLNNPETCDDFGIMRPMIEIEQTNFKVTVTQEEIINLPVR
jgi:hypothetical protein